MLHLDGKAHVSLIDLVNLNSNAVLSGVDAVSSVATVK